jgi:hypothetical protein
VDIERTKVQVGLFRTRAGFGRSGLTVLLLVVALGFPPTAGAAEEADSSTESNNPMPRCGPLMDGQVYCKFGVVYECQLIDPNSLERRTGWRWKADILRSCAREKPATMDLAVPPVVTYAPEYDDRPCPRPLQNGRRPAARTDNGPSVGTMRVHPDSGGCPPAQGTGR